MIDDSGVNADFPEEDISDAAKKLLRYIVSDFISILPAREMRGESPLSELRKFRLVELSHIYSGHKFDADPVIVWKSSHEEILVRLTKQGEEFLMREGTNNA